MSDQIRPYEPLTSENAALVLVDHQVGLMTGVRDYSTGELKHNVVALVGHHLYRVGLPTLARLATSSMVKSRTDFS